MQERERPSRPHRPPEQGTIRVRLHPLAPDVHGLTEPSFTRYFDNMATYQRVRQQMQWDYVAVEVWTRQGNEWQPDSEYTKYSPLWSGAKITDPLPKQETERR